MDMDNLKPGDKWVRVKHDPANNRTIVLLIEITKIVEGGGLDVVKSCLQNDGSWKVLREGEKQKEITPIDDVFIADYSATPWEKVASDE
ncbi:MAG: hypothetical protein HN916_18365 [Anaerolineae bacterium]|jgi:hypothetical protein|nr:hypothetical protein [Anaerolineae bacterium]